MKIKLNVELSDDDAKKHKVVRSWLVKNGFPDIAAPQDSYIYRTGLDLAFNMATGKLDKKKE